MNQMNRADFITNEKAFEFLRFQIQIAKYKKMLRISCFKEAVWQNWMILLKAMYDT